MKKFNLKLSSVYWLAELDEIEKSKRKFHSIWIDQNARFAGSVNCFVRTFTALTRILTAHGPQLRQLKITQSDIEFLHELLKLTPLLESLELVSATLYEMQVISFPQLKTLRVNYSSDDILDLIKTKNLTTLEVTHYENREFLVKFIKGLPMLQSLTIDHSAQMFQDDSLTHVTFKLKQCGLLDKYGSVRPNEELLKQFLKLHEGTMENLSLDLAIGVDVHRFVFTELKSLKRLELNVTNLPNDKSFYSCMPTLEHVKSLKLQGKFRKHEVAKAFLANFPALEDLDLKDVATATWSSKFLKTIASVQKNLQHLAIRNFFEGTRKNLHFKHLKSVHVKIIHNASRWMNFVLTHMTLEKITVEGLEHGKLSSEEVESLLELPEIRYLYFTGNVGNIRKIYDVVKKDSKNLEAIVLNIKTHHEKVVKMKIAFPFERGTWCSKDYDEAFADLSKCKR